MSGWSTNCQRSGWNVSGYDCPGCDECIATNGHTGEDDSSGTNRCARLNRRTGERCVIPDWMVVIREDDLGAEKHFVSDGCVRRQVDVRLKAHVGSNLTSVLDDRVGPTQYVIADRRRLANEDAMSSPKIVSDLNVRINDRSRSDAGPFADPNRTPAPILGEPDSDVRIDVRVRADNNVLHGFHSRRPMVDIETTDILYAKGSTAVLLLRAWQNRVVDLRSGCLFADY